MKRCTTSAIDRIIHVAIGRSQRRGGQQAPVPAVTRYGRGGQALHGRHGPLGVALRWQTDKKQRLAVTVSSAVRLLHRKTHPSTDSSAGDFLYIGPRKSGTEIETVATLPGDLGLIPIAEALKSATSRTGGKPNVIARGPEPCSPGISRARSRIGPGSLATVSGNSGHGNSVSVHHSCPGNSVSVHHSYPKRRTDTELRGGQHFQMCLGE